jgi:GWxTD domain-containing protein
MIRIGGILILLGLLAGCGTGRFANQNNFSHLYDKSTSAIHPEFLVYHQTADTSILYFKINSDELLYLREDQSKPFSAQAKIHYRVYASIESKEILDSLTTTVVDRDNERKSKQLIGKLPLNLKMPGTYIIKINTADAHRSSEHETVINIDKSNTNTRQNFLIQTTDGETIFTTHLGRSLDLKISSNLNKGKKVFARYYNRDFPLAPPPFSMYRVKPFRYEADSLFEQQLSNDGIMNLSTPETGFLHLQTDTSAKAGLTLYRFQDGYPGVTQVKTMLEPLRYICAKEEFQKIAEAASPKEAVDQFWLDHAGSKERAREVIRKFYNRVQDANTHFTSHVEGWKTDRGLIAIIYGTPNVIYKGSNSETWVYGEEHNIMSISFTFVKVNNPFSDNDFSLTRNTLYKTNWYRAVESWRQGRVYSSN